MCATTAAAATRTRKYTHLLRMLLLKGLHSIRVLTL